MFLTAGGWQGRVTTKMWLLREAELTRLKAVTVTLNSPVLQRVKHKPTMSFRPSQQVDIQWRSGDEGQQTQVHPLLQPLMLHYACLHLEEVLLCALSGPWRPVSEIPQEVHFSSCTDPTIHHHRVVQQDGRLVQQPVEPHWSLDEQREDIGGDPGPTSWPDQNYIIPAWKQKDLHGSTESWLIQNDACCFFVSNLPGLVYFLVMLPNVVLVELESPKSQRNSTGWGLSSDTARKVTSALVG